MDSSLFPSEAALYELVGYCGSYVGVGIGLALAVWMIGHVVYFVIDVVRGGI